MPNPKTYKQLWFLRDVAKKSLLRLLRQGIDEGINSLNCGRYSEASQRFGKVVDDIEGRLPFNKHNGHFKYHIQCLSSAAFGQGFAEGLNDLKTSQTRNLTDLAILAKNFYEAVTLPKSQTETHKKIGKSYGALGLEKEGREILVNSRKINIISCYYRSSKSQ